MNESGLQNDSTISRLLKLVAQTWGSEPFTNGDCHTLAHALYLANGERGILSACLRESVDDTGSVFSTGYSHMVYQAPSGSIFDISGDCADERWEEDFNLPSEPDKWGMFDRFVWVDVDVKGLHEWLHDHYGAIDEMLTSQLVRFLKEKSFGSFDRERESYELC